LRSPAPVSSTSKRWAGLVTLALVLCMLVVAPGLLGGPIAAANQSSVPRVIAIDPGHGGYESGAVYRSGGVVQLMEKNVNLEIARFLADELRDAGYEPVLTRTTDAQVNVPATDRNGDGRVDNDDDLQARVDVANEAGASLLISIHNNGSTNPRTRGTSTWFADAHPQGARGRAFGQLVQAELLAGLREDGYADPIDQGANDDTPLQKPYGHLFLVGPQTPRVARVSAMPGVVGESLYITSDVESQLLASESVQRAIAAAYRRGVEAYFARFPE
jgi:N-acetylmuramoyl-L-alanine amidase